MEVIPQITQFAISSEGAESRWCTTIHITDDQEYEGEVQESLVVSLSVSDTAVIINRNSATVSILDNEGMHLVIQSRHLPIYKCIFGVRRKFYPSPSYSLLSAEVVFQKLRSYRVEKRCNSK